MMKYFRNPSLEVQKPAKYQSVLYTAASYKMPKPRFFQKFFLKFFLSFFANFSVNFSVKRKLIPAHLLFIFLSCTLIFSQAGGLRAQNQPQEKKSENDVTKTDTPDKDKDKNKDGDTDKNIATDKKEKTTQLPNEVKKIKNLLDKSEDKQKKSAEDQQKEKRTRFLKSMLKTFAFGTSKERLEALSMVENLSLREEIEIIKPGIAAIFKEGRNKLLLRKAIEVAGTLQLKEFVPQIKTYVSDNNSEVRRTAILTLDKLKAKEAGKEILKFLRKQDLSVNDNSTIAAISTLSNLENSLFAYYALNTMREEYPDVAKVVKAPEILVKKEIPAKDSIEDKNQSDKQKTPADNQSALAGKNTEKTGIQKTDTGNTEKANTEKVEEKNSEKQPDKKETSDQKKKDQAAQKNTANDSKNKDLTQANKQDNRKESGAKDGNTKANAKNSKKAIDAKNLDKKSGDPKKSSGSEQKAPDQDIDPQKTQKPKVEYISVPVSKDLVWKRDEGQKMDITLQGQIILGLGNMAHKPSGPFLNKLLEAAFRADRISEDSEDGKSIDRERNKLTVNMGIFLQSYIINSLGKMDYQPTKALLKDKIARIESYLSDDRKKKYLSIYLQSLAALVRLGDAEVNKTLIASLKDDSPGVRLRSARLLAELRSADAVPILTYRAMYDQNRKVRFEALKTLMEILKPGSTRDGNVIGSVSDSAAQQKAREGLAEFLDPEKNRMLQDSSVVYLSKRIFDEKIEKAVVSLYKKRTGRFLPRSRQEEAVRALSSLVISKLKKEKTIAKDAHELLQNLENNRRLRYAAREAKRSLREIEQIKEELGLGTEKK